MEFENRIPSIMSPENFANKDGGAGGRNIKPVEVVEKRFATEDELIAKDLDGQRVFIVGKLLSQEDDLYGGPEHNTREHILLFLVAGPEGNAATAKTFSGEPIYKNHPGKPKDPEIVEARSAISDHFNKKPDMPRVISELADVAFNLQKLTIRDQAQADVYKTWVKILAHSSGMTERELLLTSSVKYNRRMEYGKDPSGEEAEMGRLIKKNVEGESTVSEPTDDQLILTYELLHELGNDVIVGRLRALNTTKKYSDMLGIGADDRD